MRRLCSNQLQQYEKEKIRFIEIDKAGDVLLDIRDAKQPTVQFNYKVNRSVLIRSSPYFLRLFDSKSFSEGLYIEQELSKLDQEYESRSNAPIAKLPVVTISDVGTIARECDCKEIVTDFLQILSNQLSRPRRTFAIPHMASLVVVADRFEALKPLKVFFDNSGWSRRVRFQSPRKIVNNQEGLRQLLLICILMNDPIDCFMPLTHQLITKGPCAWDDPNTKLDDDAMWWDLPRGIEGKPSYFSR